MSSPKKISCWVSSPCLPIKIVCFDIARLCWLKSVPLAWCFVNRVSPEYFQKMAAFWDIIFIHMRIERRKAFWINFKGGWKIKRRWKILALLVNLSVWDVERWKCQYFHGFRKAALSLSGSRSLWSKAPIDQGLQILHPNTEIILTNDGKLGQKRGISAPSYYLQKYLWEILHIAEKWKFSRS